MALLPNADRAFVASAKITKYLLSPDHPRGGPKCAFFESFGFGIDHWEDLRDALLAHAVANPVVAVHLRGVAGRPGVDPARGLHRACTSHSDHIISARKATRHEQRTYFDNRP